MSDEHGSQRRGRDRRSALERVAGRSTIVLTGASSGIGAATARQLGAAGATLALVARRKERLKSVAAEVRVRGGAATVHPCDLSDLDATAETAREILATHDRVDVLVNNAGRSIRRAVYQSYDRIHDYERTMRLNYLAAVQLVLVLLPGMREQRHGHIVNVSSIAVQARPPRFSAYAASKAALDAFADCVAAEAGHEGVRFTTVHMPLVRTPMLEPTRLYDLVPAISDRQAAAMICDAIVKHPRTSGTVPGRLAAFGSRVAPRSAAAIRNAAYRLLPD